MDRLTGGLSEAGLNALKSRLNRYRTENLITEAKCIAEATGQPLPVVFDGLARQRRIDDITAKTLSRIAEKTSEQNEDTSGEFGNEGRSQLTTDRWLHTFYDEAGKVDENILKEAFTRILVGEIEAPGSFSVRTLRILGGMSQLTAERFRRAVSVSIQLTEGNVVHDARICSMGGQLGQNCLKQDDLSYGVLIDLTENGLVHPDYNCYHPYGPISASKTLKKSPHHYQFPFSHQCKSWELIPNENSNATKQLRVEGAKFTSCGIELLRIVDLESLPDFTNRLKKYFSGKGYQMVPATNQ